MSSLPNQRLNILLGGKMNENDKENEWTFSIAEKVAEDTWHIMERKNYIHGSAVKILKNQNDVLNAEQLSKCWLDQFDLVLVLNWQPDHKLKDFHQKCQNGVSAHEYLSQRKWTDLLGRSELKRQAMEFKTDSKFNEHQILNKIKSYEEE